MSLPIISAGVRNVVFDFDGTCTQIPAVYAQYLKLYRAGLASFLSDLGKKGKTQADQTSTLTEQDKSDEVIENTGELSSSEWEAALDEVRQNSPAAGWTLAGCPAAPAAADPYILAYEAAHLLLRRRGKASVSLPSAIHHEAYEGFEAPWREDAHEVFSRILKAGIGIAIVSNSSSAYIEKRLSMLFRDEPDHRAQIKVYSDAGKFRVCELPWDETRPVSAKAREIFARLPAAAPLSAPGKPMRPVYLRRGQYFEALLRALNGNLDLLQNTVVCGDIWEMDLAMPAALGAKIHLVERAPPFMTYSYERQALSDYGLHGKTSTDLLGLLDWLPKL